MHCTLTEKPVLHRIKFTYLVKQRPIYVCPYITCTWRLELRRSKKSRYIFTKVAAFHQTYFSLPACLSVVLRHSIIGIYIPYSESYREQQNAQTSKCSIKTHLNIVAFVRHTEGAVGYDQHRLKFNRHVSLIYVGFLIKRVANFMLTLATFTSTALQYYV